MNNDSTIDNFEETLDEDFFTSKPIYTHFSIDISPEHKHIFNSCASTKAQLKQMGQIWSDALFKHVYAVSHKAQVESLLQAKKLAFSTVLELNPFGTKTKQQIGADSQMNFLIKEIVDEDQKLAIICHQLKIDEDELETQPLETDPHFALRSDGHELYHSIKQKRTQKEELIKKMDGMSKVTVQPTKTEIFPFAILSGKQLLETPDEEWIVDEILLRTDIFMIYGAPGCGKTFIALDLIGSAITGRKWAEKFNIKKPLNVAYSTGEGLGSVRQRFKALFIRYGIDVNNLENFSFLGEVPQLFEMQDPKNMNIFIEQWLSGVKSGLQKPLDILFIDTLHTASLGSNENCTKDMGLVIHMCRQAQQKLGCAVVLIHHSSKDGSTERGSSSLRGGMDCMIEVKKETVHCSKTKHGTAWEPIAFELVKVSGTTNVAVEWKEYAPLTKTNEDKQENKNWIMKVLKFFNENKGKFYTAHQVSNELGWSYNFWVKYLKQGLQEGVYTSSALDPSKPVHSKNPQTYGIK